MASRHDVLGSFFLYIYIFPPRFLGTSGQNVSDIQKYSSVDSHLEILENTLRLRHLAPTAPDTLG